MGCWPNIYHDVVSRLTPLNMLPQKGHSLLSHDFILKNGFGRPIAGHASTDMEGQQVLFPGMTVTGMGCLLPVDKSFPALIRAYVRSSAGLDQPLLEGMIFRVFHV